MQGRGDVETVVVEQANRLGRTAASFGKTSVRDWSVESGDLLGRDAALSIGVSRWRERSPVAADSVLSAFQPNAGLPTPTTATGGLERWMSPGDRRILMQLPADVRSTFRPMAFVDGSRRTLVLGSPLEPGVILLVSGASPVLLPIQRVQLLLVAPIQGLASVAGGADPVGPDAAVEAAIAQVEARLEEKLAGLSARVEPLVHDVAVRLAEQAEQNRRALAAADRAISAVLFQLAFGIGMGPLPGHDGWGLRYRLPASSQPDIVPAALAPWASSDPTAWLQWYHWQEAMRPVTTGPIESSPPDEPRSENRKK